MRRRHRRIGSSASLDSRSSQPSPLKLKRGDLTASLPAQPSPSLRGHAHEGAPISPTPEVCRILQWMCHRTGVNG